MARQLVVAWGAFGATQVEGNCTHMAEGGAYLCHPSGVLGLMHVLVPPGLAFAVLLTYRTLNTKVKDKRQQSGLHLAAQ